MSKKSYRQAINEAIRQEMRRDPRVIIMGEDISGGTGAPGDQDAWGGPLGVTKGLRPEFGPERVLDTHLAEISFVGAAAGAAATGLRPIVELMFVDFMGVCFDQIFNQAAKVPLHVRRQGGDAARRAHDVRRRLPRRLAALAVPLPDLHPHPRAEGGAAVERLRGEGPADPGDPRRRPGDLLRAQGHVRHGDGGARRGLRHPLRRGERHARGRRRDDRRVRAHGEFRQRGGRQSEEARHLLHRRRPAHHLAARRRDDPGDGGGDRAARRRRRGASALRHGGGHRRAGGGEGVRLAAARRSSWSPRRMRRCRSRRRSRISTSRASRRSRRRWRETMDYGAKQAAE